MRITLHAMGWEMCFQPGPGWSVGLVGTRQVPYGTLYSALWGSGLPRDARRQFIDLLERSGLAGAENLMMPKEA